jgi:small multidrug resistance family-3 protein
LFERQGLGRLASLAGGGILLFAYGTFLNLAPLPFERVVGIYIATLFVLWQIVTFFTFRSIPNLPILVGGTLIIVGGLIVSFWNPSASTEG